MTYQSATRGAIDLMLQSIQDRDRRITAEALAEAELVEEESAKWYNTNLIEEL